MENSMIVYPQISQPATARRMAVPGIDADYGNGVLDFTVLAFAFSNSLRKSADRRSFICEMRHGREN
jgi:hypothetical protein